jgi:hypothetical protein
MRRSASSIHVSNTLAVATWFFIAQAMSFTHTGKHHPVVFAQFGEHVERIDIVCLVIASSVFGHFRYRARIRSRWWISS